MKQILSHKTWWKKYCGLERNDYSSFISPGSPYKEPRKNLWLLIYNREQKTPPVILLCHPRSNSNPKNYNKPKKTAKKRDEVLEKTDYMSINFACTY